MAMITFGIMRQPDFSASFITAFVFSTSISGLLYFFGAFDIFGIAKHCNPEENDKVLIIMSLAQTTVAILCSFVLKKLNNKGAILGIAPAALISIVILLVKGPG